MVGLDSPCKSWIQLSGAKFQLIKVGFVHLANQLDANAQSMDLFMIFNVQIYLFWGLRGRDYMKHIHFLCYIIHTEMLDAYMESSTTTVMIRYCFMHYRALSFSWHLGLFER